MVFTSHTKTTEPNTVNYKFARTSKENNITSLVRVKPVKAIYKFVRTLQETHYLSATSPTG
jgi:hypothetical protein